jgi:hypothetical protein
MSQSDVVISAAHFSSLTCSLRLYDTMPNFVVNLLENERGPMNGQDLTKTDYDPERSGSDKDRL